MKKAVFVLCCIICCASIPQLYCSGSELPENEIDLGRSLFFDTLLSSTRKISCASCHKPEFAFADTGKVSLGVFDRKGVRNTPSAMNLNTAEFFFWDGRAVTLAEQALIPIANPVEMNLPVDSAVHRLQNSAFYNEAFSKVFGKRPDATNLGKALAAFQQSLETSDSPFDEWKRDANETAVSESTKRGFNLFNGKANCVKCHFGSDFSNNEFRNIGLFDQRLLTDSGRSVISRLPEDVGKFKIGPLRNIALTAPYMHNGMFATLRQVIDYYDDPDAVVANSTNRDTLLSKPLHLTETEKADLENFLRSLTSKSLVRKTDKF